MASASDHRAHAALQPADCLILLPQRLPAAVETSIVPAHYPAECTQSDAFLQPSLRARKGRANSNSFCDAVLDVKALMLANFENYQAIFPKQCDGTPITLTDDKMISHVYGWAPFTEAASGKGCGAGVNLLENTPGYSENHYAKYLPVKEEFDTLNYGIYT